MSDRGVEGAGTSFVWPTANIEQHQVLAGIVRRIPSVCAECEALQHNAPREDSLSAWLLRSGGHRHAVEQANVALAAATDALTGIHSLVIDAEAIHLATEVTLARQACESALLARWLVECHDLGTLRLRGFGAAWRSAEEQRKFVNWAEVSGVYDEEWVDKNRNTVEKLQKALVADGRKSSRSIPAAAKPNKNGSMVPVQPVPTSTELFKQVHMSDGKESDHRWLYSMMSGMAHGYAWATIGGSKSNIVRECVEVDDSGVVSPTGTVLSEQTPSVALITYCVLVAVLQVQTALQGLKDLAAAPAPGVGYLKR